MSEANAKKMPPIRRKYKVLVLGDQGVGKTTLIHEARQANSDPVGSNKNHDTFRTMGDLTISNIPLASKPVDIEAYDLQSSSINSISKKNSSLQRTLTRSMKQYDRGSRDLRGSKVKVTRSSKGSSSIDGGPTTTRGSKSSPKAISKGQSFRQKFSRSRKLVTGSSFGKADIAHFAVEYDAVILVYSVSDESSFNSIKTRWYFEVSRLLILKRPCLLLVGTYNQQSLPRTVTETQGFEMAKSINAAGYVEATCSSAEGRVGSDSSSFRVIERLAEEIDMHKRKTGLSVPDLELSKNFRELTLHKREYDGSREITFGTRMRRLMWSCNRHCCCDD